MQRGSLKQWHLKIDFLFLIFTTTPSCNNVFCSWPLMHRNSSKNILRPIRNHIRWFDVLQLTKNVSTLRIWNLSPFSPRAKTTAANSLTSSVTWTSNRQVFQLALRVTNDIKCGDITLEMRRVCKCGHFWNVKTPAYQYSQHLPWFPILFSTHSSSSADTIEHLHVVSIFTLLRLETLYLHCKRLGVLYFRMIHLKLIIHLLPKRKSKPLQIYNSVLATNQNIPWCAFITKNNVDCNDGGSFETVYEMNVAGGTVHK